MYNSVIEAIGNTPLIRMFQKNPVNIYAKLEYLSPSLSIKARSSAHMIAQAEKNGQLKPGGTIIEASSGNQGIATAMIGALKGYNVIIVIADKISLEKQKALQAYGAKLVKVAATQDLNDQNSYHQVAVQLAQKTPNSFMPNQYYNPDNAQAHYQSLGPEIWKQTQGKITHFFAAAGTGGTVSGAGKYLKEQNPDITVIGVDAENSYRSTHGKPSPYNLEGIGVDFDAPLLKNNVIDHFITVSDAQATAMLQHLAQKEGLLVGPSSGAVAYAAQQYFEKISYDNNHCAVCIFGDSGRAYLSKDFYTTD